jgi:hypothetical protein
MSRLLKLTNLVTYIGALTKTGVGEECAKIMKGQVVRWDDKDAESVLTGHNIDKEGEKKPYFTDVTDEHTGKVDWDFSKEGKDPEARTVAQPDTATARASTVQATPRRSQRQIPARTAA